MCAGSSDVQRASRLAAKQISGVTVGDEPIVIDTSSPLPRQHWVVSQIGVTGFFVTRVPAANPIATVGLYLVPANSPIESQTDGANTTYGVNPGSRAIYIPSALVITRAGAGGQYFFVCTATLYTDLIVPTGWLLRFIANVTPGTATPGPGAGSSAAMVALVTEETNAQPVPAQHV